jgi:hypothetical protein
MDGAFHLPVCFHSGSSVLMRRQSFPSIGDAAAATPEGVEVLLADVAGCGHLDVVHLFP